MRTNFRSQISLIFFGFALLLASPRSLAADKGAQFGILFGPSVLDAENTSPYQLSGVKGVAFLGSNFSLGGYYLVSNSAGEPSSVDKFRYSLHGVQAAYLFPTSGGDTSLGFRLGLSKVKNSPNGSDVTYSPYHYGIAVGYDYNLNAMFSVGFEGSFLHVFDAHTTQNAVEVEMKAFNAISFLLALQMRF